MRVSTVGHSTHSLDELHALLAQHDVGRVADVRRVPRSAHHPQIRAEALAAGQPKRGVLVAHLVPNVEVARAGHTRVLAVGRKCLAALATLANGPSAPRR
jgi:uncharacterized protein (DUF488 family)